MDRKRAQTLTGQYILIEEQENGQYIGELLEVIIESKKPWRGLVKILAVESLPKQQIEQDEHQVQKPLYQEGHIQEFPSSKIKETSVTETANYEDSLINAVTREIEAIKFANEQNDSIINGLITYLDEISPLVAQLYKSNEQEEQDDNRFIYYTVEKENGQFKLFDRIQDQSLVTNGYPFEFELFLESKWEKGYFLDPKTFQLTNGKKYSVSAGQKFRFERVQFEPYQILLNELEKPAAQSLEQSLTSLGLSHSDVTYCHNALLIMLLQSENEKKFSGVNFISYQNKYHTVIVQHHFERLLKEDIDDVYDRFEITTDKGKRQIVTYTNEFSQGK